MQVLIDTNVFIERESDWVVSEVLQDLEKTLRIQSHDILVHKLSKREIQNYENDGQREKAESKIATYAELRLPKYPKSTDTAFRAVVQEAEDFNERVDNALLYAVYSGQVDVLITQDQGIHQKAHSLGIAESVFTIEEGRDYFREEPPEVTGPPSIQKAKVSDLDIDDPIFDSLKGDYEFGTWFQKHPNRDTYVNWNLDETLGAVLIIKPGEVEAIGDKPPLVKKERLKISTLKVAQDRRGSKIGELLISIAIREAVHHEIDEIYLTHYIQDNDYLVQLISQYGFTKASETEDGEGVFVKRLISGPKDDPSPRETHVRFYPSYYDGEVVDKFLIPIRPEYHGRLFTSYEKRQPKLSEFTGQFYSEGNAIKKAYLSHANTRQLKSEDVLLFYRSNDYQEVTSLGVCERVEYDITDANTIHDIVGERSVFTDYEIQQQAKSPTTVILFKWHFDLPSPIHYQVLLEKNIIDGAIQTIQKIDHESYRNICQLGGLDERFIIN